MELVQILANKHTNIRKESKKRMNEYKKINKMATQCLHGDEKFIDRSNSIVFSKKVYVFLFFLLNFVLFFMVLRESLLLF